MSVPEVIGEGAFGCVHSPSLHCDDKPNADYGNKVSKLMDRKNALQELSEYVGIEKADPDHKYYLGNPILCTPDNSDVTKLAVKKCHDGFSEKALLIMKDGGLNIKQLVSEWSRMPITPTLINEVTDFWLETHKLLVGLKLFLKNDIVHHDLKAENIVYNKKTKTISFIDFGHMGTLSLYSKYAAASKTGIAIEHWSYPWENIFITKKHYKKMASKSDAIKKKHAGAISKKMTSEKTPYGVFMYQVLPKNNALLDQNTKYSADDVDELVIETQIDYFVQDYLDFLLKSKPGNYDSFLKKSIETFDLFGVGFALAYAWRNTAHILLHTHINVVLLNTTIFGMLRPDVYDRYNVDSALGVYETVLQPLALAKGLEFQNNVLKPKMDINVSTVKPKPISDKRLEKITEKADSRLVNNICPHGKMLNPLTGRCVKECDEGQYRNKQFRCITARKTAKKSAKKPVSSNRTLSVKSV